MKQSDLFFSAFLNLKKQEKALTRYQGMNIILKILLAITLLPVIVLDFLLSIEYILWYGIYKILCVPSTYLMTFIKEQGQDVKHATQFIIYFFGFPIVMLLQVINAIVSIVLFISFIILSITGHIFTLGGTTFSPFVFEQKERTEKDKLAYPNCNAAILLIFVSVIVLMTVILVYCVNNLYINWEKDPFKLMILLYIVYLVLATVDFKNDLFAKNNYQYNSFTYICNFILVVVPFLIAFLSFAPAINGVFLEEIKITGLDLAFGNSYLESTRVLTLYFSRANFLVYFLPLIVTIPIILFVRNKYLSNMLASFTYLIPALLTINIAKRTEIIIETSYDSIRNNIYDTCSDFLFGYGLIITIAIAVIVSIIFIYNVVLYIDKSKLQKKSVAFNQNENKILDSDEVKEDDSNINE